MSEHAFTVWGTPKAQPRAKAFRRGAHAGIYNPKTADDWKRAVMIAATAVRPESPLEGPVEVRATFYLPRPKRLCRQRDPDGPVPCASKPDRDNLEKALLDSLTAIAFWHDDAQVWAGEIRKMYHAKGAAPSAHVVVRTTES